MAHALDGFTYVTCALRCAGLLLPALTYDCRRLFGGSARLVRAITWFEGLLLFYLTLNGFPRLGFQCSVDRDQTCKVKLHAAFLPVILLLLHNYPVFR